MFLDDLSSCAELTAEHAAQAARSLASMRALLRWAEAIARPGEGAPKLLMAFGHLADAEWVEGTPHIEIRGDATTTTLSVFADLGMGIRERVLPLARLGVAFDEFARAVRLAPRLARPFTVAHRQGALVLTLPGTSLDGERAAIAIDPRSLREEERETSPPPGAPVTSAPPRADHSGLHTAPTVRRMVAVVPEARRSGNDDSD